MKTMKQQKLFFALLALLLILGACKGESPTAPPSGGGGSTPPPTGSNTTVVTLTSSSASPVVDSTVTITAVVTINGSPAPNGTAVEFASAGDGGFESTTNKSIIKTTTNGVATTTFSSSVAGGNVISATVGNVTRTVNVTFVVRPVVDPPDSTTPSIEFITPAIGRPAGGELIRITGDNFKAPVRVLFDLGGPVPVEAFVVSVSETVIEVISPAVNLGAGQQLDANIIVLTEVGTANEQRVEREDAFIFRNEQLTPVVSTASPNSGPVTGGTIVTIFGEGFQAPVQVLFDTAEARVINVKFSEIIVEAPAGRDTSPGGSGTITGPVDITVRNIASNTSVTAVDTFLYKAALDVTSISPTFGASTGGTEVLIDGIGFTAPVEVTIGNLHTTVLRVSGTQILVRTNPAPSPCGSFTGTVLVKNVVNGDFEVYGDDPDEQTFSYVGVQPLITSVTPVSGVLPGGNLSLIVRDPGIGPLGFGDVRFTLNGRSIIPSPSQVTNGAGNQTFNVAVPTSGFTFPTIACTVGGFAGTQFGPLETPITFNNITTGCTDLTTVVIIPDPATNLCLTTPRPSVTDPAGGSCANPVPATVGVTAGFPLTSSDTITIANAANSQPLNITGVAISGTSASEFRITPTTASNIAAGGSQVFTLTFDPTAAGAKDATVTFTTNSTLTPTITVCVQATAVP